MTLTITDAGILTMTPTIPAPTTIAYELLDLGAFLRDPYPADDADEDDYCIPATRIQSVMWTFRGIADALDYRGSTDLNKRLRFTNTRRTTRDMVTMAEDAAEHGTWCPMDDPDNPIEPDSGLALISLLDNASEQVALYGKITDPNVLLTR